MREQRCCRRCGAPLKLKYDKLLDIAHPHEIVLRSAGGSPTDTRNVIALCWRCHLNGIHRQTANQAAWFVIVIVNVEKGADDPHGIEFAPFETKAERWERLMSNGETGSNRKEHST
jgi:hypothetical protein